MRAACIWVVVGILLAAGAATGDAARNGGARGRGGQRARLTIVEGGRMTPAQQQRARARTALREILHAGHVGWLDRTIRVHDARGARLDRSAAIESHLESGRPVFLRRHQFDRATGTGRSVGPRVAVRSMSQLLAWHADVGAGWLRANRAYHLLELHD